jgi:predicted regulator of Ras-like GTPase activity (Roadblock/LC7/MglB family)
MLEQYDNRAERLVVALDEFIHSSPDVEAAAIVSFDGLPMASALPDDLEEDRLGAMSAALLSLGEQAALGLGRGQLNQVFVEGEHGFVFLMSARDQAVLAAIARRTAKIGFMLYEMRRAADRVGGILEPVAETPPAPPTSPPVEQHETFEQRETFEPYPPVESQAAVERYAPAEQDQPAEQHNGDHGQTPGRLDILEAASDAAWGN